jgi:hypothetical protein
MGFPTEPRPAAGQIFHQDLALAIGHRDDRPGGYFVDHL